jgi:glycosyltransferase involved in cell wall biosynthesis
LSASTVHEAAVIRACVVVPAHDEQELIGACMRALAAQETDARFAVILVLDRCTDANEARAREAFPELFALRVDGGVGAARRAGMDHALTLLDADGLMATTDADSEPAPDWLHRQLEAVGRGARAIGGRVELGAGHALPPAVIARRERDARDRFARLDGPGAREHHQFSGASIGVTAATYARVGLEPREALEDEGFERALRRAGVPIDRLGGVRVTTSGRTRGRAARGLALDLERSDWLARRAYTASAFPLERLLAAKDRTISVILPARETATTLAGILDALATLEPLIDEVLVVDANSRDGTAAVARSRGVAVADESELLPEFGPGLGKGDAMWRGLAVTTGELVVFLDTDTENFDPSFALGLLGPLLTDDVSFVKGAFRRPLRIGEQTLPDGGGRVTELVARPYLNLHVPRLAGFRQPLAGELAAERALLEQLPFPVGYGVEIAMLIDVLELAGLDRMAQVDLGTRQNRHQPLSDLSAMALAVIAAAERRIHGSGAIAAAAPGPLWLPHGRDFETRTVITDERPPLALFEEEELDLQVGPDVVAGDELHDAAA